MRTPRLVYALLAGLCGLTSSAFGMNWSTDDGLTIELDDATGIVKRVSVDGRSLPLKDPETGGWTIQEFARDPNAPEQTLLEVTAEQHDDGSWSAASFADWQTTEDTVRRKTGGAAAGEGYLEIGDGEHPGVGMAATKVFPVQPGSACRITWQGRTHVVGVNYILCVRFFDAEQHDITDDTTASQGWTYSPYSKAHYRVDAQCDRADVWQGFSYPFLVPEQVAFAQVSLRVYRGGELKADIDDLKVLAQPGGWGPVMPVRGPVTEAKPEVVTGLEQRCEVPPLGVAVVVYYGTGSALLRLMAQLQPLGARPEGCFRLRYRLPLDLVGWTWSGRPRDSETIVAGGRYDESFALAGHPMNRYLVTAVEREQVGLALYTEPRFSSVSTIAAWDSGLVASADLATSPQVQWAVPACRFYFRRHEPGWGFRAALEQSYQLDFDLWEDPATAGAWTLRMPKPELAQPADFGLKFYECGTVKPEVREYCRQTGVKTLFYIEPWGKRQTFPEAKSRGDLPSYEQRLAQLKAWAADPDPTQRWGSAPRHEAARAVLNSLLLKPDGTAEYLVDLYSHWSQWWQLNVSPSLGERSIGQLCYQYEVLPAVAWADGIYLDSVSLTHAEQEDHDPNHLQALELAPTFSLATGAPVMLSGQAQYQFISGLADELHRRGKLLMANLFPPATRLFGAIVDIAGCELAGPETDEMALQQRIYAYHKPVSNLLQYQWAVLNRVPAMTSDQMEAYLANQLCYGFHPGISTAGGGTKPGYAGMHRYLEDPELVARDKPLFAKYLPVFDALAAAGWEPVTHARPADPKLLVERFGDGPVVYLTLYNPTDQPITATLNVDDWWPAEVVLEPVLGGRRVRSGDSLDVPAGRTVVVKGRRPEPE